MNKKYAIFDMDGTLIDSMTYWENLGREYLSMQGVPENLDAVMEEIKPLTMTESAELFRTRFSLSGTKESIAASMNWMIEEHYRKDIPLKNGVKDYLAKLHASGVKMCVASATDKALMETCLERLGIKGYFEFILSCEEVGAGKRKPDVYFEAVRRMENQEKISPESVAVFEDADYAIHTALEAGFYTIAVYDDSNKDKWEKLKMQTREFIEDWESQSQTMLKKKTALTIAGSDCSGGAGIQADLKTMTMNGVYAMSVITALTAQNTTGVRSIMEVTPTFLREQMDAIFEDIRPDAVKIGMVSSSHLICAIAEGLEHYKAKNIVIDPVMVATSGSKLIAEDALSVLKETLLPLATVITPNIPEAEILTGMKIEGEEDMLQAAKKIGETYHCAVLCKGGHNVNDANDLLYFNGEYHWFYGKRIQNPNTHGTGCTLSSAIASNLAKGYYLCEAVEKAKEYISGALSAMLDLGRGSGPMDHGYLLKNVR